MRVLSWLKPALQRDAAGNIPISPGKLICDQGHHFRFTPSDKYAILVLPPMLVNRSKAGLPTVVVDAKWV